MIFKVAGKTLMSIRNMNFPSSIGEYFEALHRTLNSTRQHFPSGICFRIGQESRGESLFGRKQQLINKDTLYKSKSTETSQFLFQIILKQIYN